MFVRAVCLVAFFGDSEAIAFAGYNDDLVTASRGRLFGNQLLGVVMIAIWVCFWIGLLFFTLNTIGWLRVSLDTEKEGLDEKEHGGQAVDFKAPYKQKTSVARKTSVLGLGVEEANAKSSTDDEKDAMEEEKQPLKVTQKSTGIANIMADDESDDDDNKASPANKDTDTAMEQQDKL